MDADHWLSVKETISKSDVKSNSGRSVSKELKGTATVFVKVMDRISGMIQKMVDDVLLWIL